MNIDREALAPLCGGLPDAVEPLHGDGSSRRYFRVHVGQRQVVLLVGPDPRENAAFVRIAGHLSARGIRVPSVLGVDEARGRVVVEDVGDQNLFSAVADCRTEQEILDLYGPVLDLLVRVQIDGARGFSLSVGFATAPYDDDLRVEGEGMYFAREFAGGLLGLPVPAGFEAELRRLSAEAGRAPAGYFLHRDFQSRNIQMIGTGPCLLDFQGARPGPVAYDAAALILDPYVGHGSSLRQELQDAYWSRLRSRDVDVEAAEASWYSMGAFRLFQALGAFGKLGGRFAKPGFLEHASKALATLREHLGERGEAEFPALVRLVDRCRNEWEARQRSAEASGGAWKSLRAEESGLRVRSS